MINLPGWQGIQKKYTQPPSAGLTSHLQTVWTSYVAIVVLGGELSKFHTTQAVDQSCYLTSWLMAGPARVRPSLRIPNWALAGFLAAVVGGTYLSAFTRVSHDDLDKELQRELDEEAAKQQKQRI